MTPSRMQNRITMTKDTWNLSGDFNIIFSLIGNNGNKYESLCLSSQWRGKFILLQFFHSFLDLNENTHTHIYIQTYVYYCFIINTSFDPLLHAYHNSISSSSLLGIAMRPSDQFSETVHMRKYGDGSPLPSLWEDDLCRVPDDWHLMYSKGTHCDSQWWKCNNYLCHIKWQNWSLLNMWTPFKGTVTKWPTITITARTFYYGLERW